MDMTLMNEQLDLVSEMLEKMDVSHVREKLETPEGAIPIIVAPFDVQGMTFDVIFFVDQDWIHAKCRVFTLTDEIKDNLEARLVLYNLCLTANFYLNKVSFSADDNGHIHVGSDMRHGVRQEDFEDEISSMIVGIDYFMRILKRMLQQ